MSFYAKYSADNQKQGAFENACDCFYYGCGKDKWNPCGLQGETATKVWKAAFWWMAEEKIPAEYMDK